jgi:hypothetical protein
MVRPRTSPAVEHRLKRRPRAADQTRPITVAYFHGTALGEVPTGTIARLNRDCGHHPTLLGAVADRSGLPATYAALAVIVGLPSLVVLVVGRRYLWSAQNLRSPVDAAVSLHETAA